MFKKIECRFLQFVKQQFVDPGWGRREISWTILFPMRSTRTFKHQNIEPMENSKHREGQLARKIEEKTAQMPSDIYLWGALVSMGVSMSLKCMGHKHEALFVGQWAAPFLLLGIYNKIVKTEGHDQQSQKEGIIT